jgi:8-oxo-dGTP pyrophosphatase MutT (NUDIX family)
VLDLDVEREGTPPKDAATVIVVRDAPGGGKIEIFCVERNIQSRFLGGALVFPGGKVDDSDRDPAWDMLATESPDARGDFATDASTLRALRIAACRETLEEAALLTVAGGAVSDADVIALRARLAEPGALTAFLRTRRLRLDLGGLRPFAHWVTPAAEARRYDTRFFLARAPAGQGGAHDEHETMASFWATPHAVLRRFEEGAVRLAPPTHRSFEILARATSVDDAFALADAACLDPICPRLVPQIEGEGQTLALVLPGDPEHPVREARVEGLSRYVLREGQWRSEGPPDRTP